MSETKTYTLTETQLRAALDHGIGAYAIRISVPIEPEAIQWASTCVVSSLGGGTPEPKDWHKGVTPQGREWTAYMSPSIDETAWMIEAGGAFFNVYDEGAVSQRARKLEWYSVPNTREFPPSALAAIDAILDAEEAKYAAKAEKPLWTEGQKFRHPGVNNCHFDVTNGCVWAYSRMGGMPAGNYPTIESFEAAIRDGRLVSLPPAKAEKPELVEGVVYVSVHDTENGTQRQVLGGKVQYRSHTNGRWLASDVSLTQLRQWVADGSMVHLPPAKEEEPTKPAEKSDDALIADIVAAVRANPDWLTIRIAEALVAVDALRDLRESNASREYQLNEARQKAHALCYDTDSRNVLIAIHALSAKMVNAMPVPLPFPAKEEQAPTYDEWTFETMPIVIRVKHKREGFVAVAMPYSDQCVHIPNVEYNVTYQDFLANWECVDGSPCGVRV